MEKKLAVIWEGLLKKRPIALSDNFFDLGGDSLLAVQVCTKVRTVLGKNLSVGSLCSAPTIEGLARVIHLAPSRPPTTRPPFFCLPSLMQLAKHMGADQAFYGLQYPPHSVLASADTTIEKIAEDCIRQIFAIQDAGPYYIGGYSFGGVVAFEIARQLTEVHGEEVPLLAMLDPDPPKPYLANFAVAQGWRYTVHRRNLARLNIRGKIQYLAESLREATRRVRKLTHEDEDAVQVEIFNRATEAVHAKYEAKRYGGPVALILARDTQWRQESKGDQRLDWNRYLTGQTEVYEVPGDHGAVYKEPHVRELAERLAACLAKAARTGEVGARSE